MKTPVQTSCPVCAAANDQFATVCVSCGGYIQNRVVNLDFFATVWKILETPSRAFRDIAMAEHKNYIFLLFALFGINASFALKSIFALGGDYDMLMEAITHTIVDGTVYGVVVVPLCASMYHGLARLAGGRGGFRSSLAVFSYAMVPAAFVAVLVPFFLALYGIYFFTGNPPPYVIKPVPYYALGAITLGFIGWWMVLCVEGTRIAHQMERVRALAVAAAGIILLGAAFVVSIAKFHWFF